MSAVAVSEAVELTSDRDFTDFLAAVPLSVMWREGRVVLPSEVVAAIRYQEVSGVLVEALRSGSVVRLTLALEGVL